MLSKLINQLQRKLGLARRSKLHPNHLGMGAACLGNANRAIGSGLQQHDYQILLISRTKPGMTSPQSIEVGDSYISGSCPGR